MQVRIARKNANMSESLKDYIEDKLSVLSSHYGKIIDANVVIEKNGKEQLVEIVLRVSRHTLAARAHSTNLRASIDSCVNKLDRQLLKAKEKARRKVLTPEEAALSGKVIVTEETSSEEEEAPPAPEQPEGAVITIRTEEAPEDSAEERTGT